MKNKLLKIDIELEISNGSKIQIPGCHPSTQVVAGRQWTKEPNQYL